MSLPNIKPFMFWSQKVLPNVYDDSLSYYEVLTKIANSLNEVITATNLTVRSLLSEYDPLKTYATNEYCWYEDGIYKSRVETTGTFNIAAWEKVTFLDSVGVDINQFKVETNEDIAMFKSAVTNAISQYEEILYNCINSVATVYNEDTSYEPGMYSAYNGTVYLCNHNTTGAFNSDHWDAITIMPYLAHYIDELFTDTVGLDDEFGDDGTVGITQNVITQIMQHLNCLPIAFLKGENLGAFDWNGYECTVVHTGSTTVRQVVSNENTFDNLNAGSTYVFFIDKGNNNIKYELKWYDDTDIIRTDEVGSTSEITVPANADSVEISIVGSGSTSYTAKTFACILYKNSTNSNLLSEINNIEDDITYINGILNNIGIKAIQYKGSITSSTDFNTLKEVGFWSMSSALTHADNPGLPEKVTTGRKFLVNFTGVISSTTTVCYQLLFNVSTQQIFARCNANKTTGGSIVPTWFPETEYGWWDLLLPPDTSLSENGRYADAGAVGTAIANLTNIITNNDKRAFGLNGSASGVDLDTLNTKGYWSIGSTSSSNHESFPNETIGRRYVYNLTTNNNMVIYQHFVNLTAKQLFYRIGTRSTIGGDVTWTNSGQWTQLFPEIKEPEKNGNLLHNFFFPNSKRYCYSKGKSWVYFWDTLPAVKAACKDNKCQIIEIDVRKTSDNIFVCYHNAKMSSSTGGWCIDTYPTPTDLTTTSIEDFTLERLSFIKVRRGIVSESAGAGNGYFEPAATTYDSTISYSTGSFCVEGGKLYKCLESTTGAFDASKWSETDDSIPTLESVLKEIRKSGKVAILEIKTPRTSNVGTLPNADLDALYNLVKSLGMVNSVIFMGNSTACDYYKNNHIDTIRCYFSDPMSIDYIADRYEPDCLFLANNVSLANVEGESPGQTIVSYCKEHDILLGGYSARTVFNQNENMINMNLDFVSVHQEPPEL